MIKMKNTKQARFDRHSKWNEKRSQKNNNPQKPQRNGGALSLRQEKIDIAQIIKRTGKHTDKKLPELFAPAGSFEALKAAIAGGADAVYFGGGDFNARKGAKNFTNDELKQAIEMLHSCGKKAYVTLNTLVHDRELVEYLRFAEFAYLAGADALIVADVGGAEAIRRHLPGLELHASTQMSGHNLAQAKLLAEQGFSRMVCAREMPKEDLEYLVKYSPIEIEMFTHGALCVCHSGQCLFSSLVGGRSGNRGECAQPCRLPYQSENGEQGYPLSLKDLSLAEHITELIDCGVHSLKIEGRMKSPEYVFGVLRAFRTLLDEYRNATADELSLLARVFSRGGFTDSYYENSISSEMLGIRSDEEKHISRTALFSSEKIDEIIHKKQEISAHAKIKLGEPMELTLIYGGLSVTAKGDAPQRAINAPLSLDGVRKNISKFGSTAFELVNFSADIDDNVIVPISSLNSIRRAAASLLEEAIKDNEPKRTGFEKYSAQAPKSAKKTLNTARFYKAEQISERAKEFFDIIYLPLQKFNGECEGIILPPVIFDSELPKIEAILQKAKEKGAKYALIGNLGILDTVKKYDLTAQGDFRFNAYNNESIAKLESLGVESTILSPELNLPQIRSIKGDTSVIVYGRIPLMLLEKCVAKEISSCENCNSDNVTLTDRKGVSFPVLREYEHRSAIYNSNFTFMADRESDLLRAGINNRHFIFSTESKYEVDNIINCYKNKDFRQSPCKIRRI